MLKRKESQLNPTHASPEATPRLARVIPRDGHPVSRSGISPAALRVLYRLREAGFEAYLVGGCVRDLMLGLTPKDFDVATNALPEQVKRLFRNCRLIGRRFRLAHVFFGREIIEVATFRASSAPAQGEEVELEVEESLLEEGMVDESALEESVPDEILLEMHASDERTVDESGRILRDNVYGSIDEDVWRRDFACNALYYNIADFSIWDYCNGYEDVQAKRLRLIGDPETRYREDPVRMLRAARFEAKLGFTIEAATAEPIARMRELLPGVPAARLFDETLKLFLTGHGARSLDVLLQRGLLASLLPNVAQFIEAHPHSAPVRMLRAGLEQTDARVLADRPVTPTFLFALLLYGPIGLEIERGPRERWSDVGHILDAVDRAVRVVHERVAVHRRFILGMRDMFALQPRLEVPRGRRALRTLEHPRFRAGFDLLELRAKQGMADVAVVLWWQRLQAADPTRRLELCEELASSSGAAEPAHRSGGSRRRGSRRRKPRARS